MVLKRPWQVLKPYRKKIRICIVKMLLACTENQRLSKGWFFFYIIPSRCAPGYYGNPMVIGNSCKRCDCNGNSDPNLIFNECHNMTGDCQHCWGNTAGANCERCAPGFYGDAITAKNCRGGSDEWTAIRAHSRDVWSVLERVMRSRGSQVTLKWGYRCFWLFYETRTIVHRDPAADPDV